MHTTLVCPVAANGQWYIEKGQWCIENGKDRQIVGAVMVATTSGGRIILA